jgi:lipopolysaccharide/colanic/teichoic acid biosynthesis glycosyltransferase
VAPSRKGDSRPGWTSGSSGTGSEPVWPADHRARSGSPRGAGPAAPPRTRNGEPLVLFSVDSTAPRQPDAHQERLRRWLNVAVALVALVVSAPLMLLIALAIKLTSPGPILYTQTRVGIDRRSRSGPDTDPRRRVYLGGRPFRLYKFRSMTVTRDRLKQVWATPEDPRITPIGRILRKYRLDELPQFFNVLKGDMNLVGPRPEQPRIFLELCEEIENYAERQRVAPGITGWAQVNQRYDQSLDDVRRKVALDLEYIARCSWQEDLKIMARTLPVMMLRKGAV